MPRNAGGTYTLPLSNPVAPNTVIMTSWANPTMADIAAALTDSLSRSGLGGMTAPFFVEDGTQVAPGLAFNNEPGSGLWRESSLLVHFVMDNANLIDFDGNTGIVNFAEVPTAASRLVAMQDAVVCGFVEGWDYTRVSQLVRTWEKGLEVLKLTLTLNGSDLIDSAFWEYSDDGGSTWADLTTGGTPVVVTSNAEGFITAVDKDAGMWVFALQNEQLAGQVIPSLGTMATQDADAVAITGGSIDGTDVGTDDPAWVTAKTYRDRTQYIAAGTGAVALNGDDYGYIEIVQTGALVLSLTLNLDDNNAGGLFVALTTSGNGAHTVTLPGGVSWLGGVAPTIPGTPAETHLFQFYKTQNFIFGLYFGTV